MPSKSTLKHKNLLKGSFVKASLINHAIFLFSLEISRYLAGYPENSLSGPDNWICKKNLTTDIRYPKSLNILCPASLNNNIPIN